MPDPTENNKNICLYSDVLRATAKKRGHAFIDLYELLGNEKKPLTDNGIHFTAYGYWRSAQVLVQNAKEIPQFEPIIAKLEAEIGRLKKEGGT